MPDQADIYALLEPGSRKVRYVGHSADAARRVREDHWWHRFQEKNRKCNPAFNAWLRSLDGPPEFFIFETVPYADRYKAERYYTDLLRQIPGVELLNINSGGMPVPGHLARMSALAASPEAKEKISVAHTGMKQSPEAIAKIRASHIPLAMRAHNTSGYKGVSWSKANRNWRAQIGVNREHLYLGGFDDPADAARAYDAAALRFFGPGAYTNFPREEICA